MTGVDVLFDCLAEFETVHAGHDHVADDHSGRHFPGLGQSFLPIAGLDDLVGRTARLRQEMPELVIVFYQQDGFHGREIGAHAVDLLYFGLIEGMRARTIGETFETYAPFGCNHPFFFLAVVGLSDRDTYEYLRSFQPFAIHPDVGLVQQRETLHQREPYTRTEMRFGDPVIPLEQMVDQDAEMPIPVSATRNQA